MKKKEKLVGEITHYFGRIGVAVVKLSGALKVGDTICIRGGETEFQQKVESMEIEHKKIKRAKPKQIVGLKVKQRVREGYRVYRL